VCLFHVTRSVPLSRKWGNTRSHQPGFASHLEDAGLDPKQKRIRKVYRRAHKPEHARSVFNAEVDALRKAGQADELRKLVPGFFGLCPEMKIIDRDGNDVTGEVYPDLAFEAEFLDGNFQKNIIAEEGERERVFALFQKHGINHVIDTNVTVQGDKISKVIDFAVQEIVPQWDDDV
jgi:hypothetical protein